MFININPSPQPNALHYAAHPHAHPAHSANQTMMMMGMMMSFMMEMMSFMMNGARPIPMGRGHFGHGHSPFPSPGAGLNNFLGGGGCGCSGAPTGAHGSPGPYGGQGQYGAHGSQGAQGSQGLYSGPAGNVGNVNVQNLINAIDPAHRPHAQRHWPAIVAEAQKQGVNNKAQLAYILATTVHESGAGKYMKEIASGRAYEGRRDLGNTQSGDGVRYKGRGYVQITGRANYRDWSRRLGMDLVSNPQMAERPEVAAKILVGGMRQGTFTGKKLGDYINGSRTDFNGARRIVNGTDKASTFARTAQRILSAMG